MKKYVALLRGINVGGNNKIAMKDLKSSFESLGFKNVATYINSGNVIFDTKKEELEKLTKRIEKVIKKDFGLDIPIVIADRTSIAHIVKEAPKQWKNDTEQKTDILFLFEGFKTKTTLKKLTNKTGIDSLIYCAGAIIWNLKRSQYGKSGINDLIGTDIYKKMTARNINTVRKLNSLMETN